jgi:hypothetical protein
LAFKPNDRCNHFTLVQLKPNAHEVEAGFLKMGDAPPKMLTARQHGKMMLECSATGNPAPTIVWIKDGQPVFEKVPEEASGAPFVHAISFVPLVVVEHSV